MDKFEQQATKLLDTFEGNERVRMELEQMIAKCTRVADKHYRAPKRGMKYAYIDNVLYEVPRTIKT